MPGLPGCAYINNNCRANNKAGGTTLDSPKLPVPLPRPATFYCLHSRGREWRQPPSSFSMADKPSFSMPPYIPARSSPRSSFSTSETNGEERIKEYLRKFVRVVRFLDTNGGRDRERVKKSGSFLFSFFSLLFFLRSLLGLSKSGKVRSVARTSLLLLEIPTLFPVLSYIILFCHRSPGRCWSSSSSSSACSSSLLPMLVFCSKVFRTRNRWRARKEPQRRARTRDSHEYCPC